MSGANRDSQHDQTKFWTVQHYLDHSREGLSMTAQELSKSFRNVWRRCGNHLWFRAMRAARDEDGRANNLELAARSAAATNEQQWETRKLELTEHLQQTTTIVYGFHTLSRLFDCSLLWIPGFIFDVQPGLLVSRRFVAVQYVVCVAGLSIGLVLVNIVLESTISQILPGLIRSVYKLIHFLVLASEFGYITYGMCSCAWVVYQRDFIREFILYQSSIITLPKEYQREQAVCIYTSALAFTFLSEPLFALLALAQDIEQDNFMPESPRLHYLLAKVAFIVLITMASMLVSMLGMVIPVLTRFLIVVITKHLETSFRKQLLRSHNTTLCGLNAKLTNRELNSLADKQVLNIICDYSCDTLMQDWPRLDDAADCSEADFYCDEQADQNTDRLNYETPDGGQSESQLESMTKREHLSVQLDSLRSRSQSVSIVQQQQQQARGSSTTGSLLFLYKNLVKSLSELKGLIESYEQKFGSFHVLFVCISGLIVSQLIVAGLTQARLMRTRNADALAASRNASGLPGPLEDDLDLEETSWAQVLTPFAFRTGIGVCIFAISNTIVFMQAHCLPDRMNKMRNQLFKINVNLALSLMDREQSDNLGQLARTNSIGQAQAQQQLLTGNRLMMNKLTGGTSNKFDWSELDQVWSLYDQVERMSRRANFKFTADTYYNKNCLLLIFGRVISLVLLYVQVIDIYSYV